MDDFKEGGKEMMITGTCFLFVGFVTSLLGVNVISSGVYILAIEAIVAGITMMCCGIGFFLRAEDPDLKRERRKEK